MPGGGALLKVLLHDLSEDPSITALCAGYEQGRWRSDELAREIIEAIPDFALSHSELASFSGQTGIAMLGRAVHSVYATEKFEKRGEFGEVLLHLALRQIFSTVPAVSKVYFKDGPNETVKGFDCVHVVATEESLELWLGEVKFYSDLGSAMSEVRAELHKHTQSDYLRSEFAAITAKIESSWPHAERLKLLLDRRTSLDEVFDSITIPVLLTHESAVVASRVSELEQCSDRGASTYEAYRAAFESEAREALSRFRQNLPLGLKIRLLLVPLHLKEVLLQELHERLTAMQRATR